MAAPGFFCWGGGKEADIICKKKIIKWAVHEANIICEKMAKYNFRRVARTIARLFQQ